MESTRFDRLTKSLSRESRRWVVAGGMASAAAFLLGRTAEESAAKSKQKKCRTLEDCPKNLACIGRRCVRCETDGDCAICKRGTCDNSRICNRHGLCTTCKSGRTGCEGSCLDLSVCPENEQHVYCNEAKTCICTRIADNNNTRFCAIPDTCEIPCGPDNVCPGNRRCVMTCCDGKGNAGLRCLNPCES